LLELDVFFVLSVTATIGTTGVTGVTGVTEVVGIVDAFELELFPEVELLTVD